MICVVFTPVLTFETVFFRAREMIHGKYVPKHVLTRPGPPREG